MINRLCILELGKAKVEVMTCFVEIQNTDDNMNEHRNLPTLGETGRLE